MKARLVVASTLLAAAACWGSAARADETAARWPKGGDIQISFFGAWGPQNTLNQGGTNSDSLGGRVGLFVTRGLQLGVGAERVWARDGGTPQMAQYLQPFFLYHFAAVRHASPYIGFQAERRIDRGFEKTGGSVVVGARWMMADHLMAFLEGRLQVTDPQAKAYRVPVGVGLATFF